jgi:hypothetical protein
MLRLLGRFGPDGPQRRTWFIQVRDHAFNCYVEADLVEAKLLVTCAGQSSSYPLELSPDTEPAPIVLRIPQ